MRHGNRGRSWWVLACGAIAMGLYGCSGGSTAPGSETSDSGADGSNGIEEGVETQSPPDAAVPDGAICSPRATQCVGSHFLTCNPDGKDWTITTCEPGTTCTPDGCVATVCRPNQADCDEQGRVIVCRPDGSGWGVPSPCGASEVCLGGMCIAKTCTDGEQMCAQTSILVCQGGTWVEVPCQPGQICFKGNCIECFSDAHCPQGRACVEGVCVVPAIRVKTTELPDGQVGAAYSSGLEAEGGQPPYLWSITQGDLPPGIGLDAGGALSGTPTQAGTYPFTATVQDQAGAIASGALEIVVHGPGLSIATKSPLPDGEDGTPYSVQFKAIGGVPPYGWMVLSGTLPPGLTLASDGLLAGTPAGHGPYDFTVRVVDTGDPLQQAAGKFQVTIKVAPLQITGDQVVDLFLTKAVVLPLITVVEGIPIPYSVQLQAKGGVKPYHWSEVPIPGFIKTFLPKAGIPQGLTLSDSGMLSGAVTSTDQVMELQIPFVNFTLTGFFFMGQVKDSQDPADSDQALFLIPTVPVNLGGGGLPLPF